MPLPEGRIRPATPGDKPRKRDDERRLYVEIRTRGSWFWRYRYRMEF